jgi:hypothetical protein
MQNQPFLIKVHTQCYKGLRFFKNLANTLQKVLNMIKLRFDFRFKRCGHEATEKRKAKNHKLPLSRHFLKFKMSLFVKFSHKLSPLFNRFSTFDKNVNLSKANPEAKFFFPSCLPLAKYLDFYDVSKNSEHIKTFREARLKKSPSQIQKFNFLKQKKKLIPKMEKFSNFFHNGEQIFHPIVTGKEII